MKQSRVSAFARAARGLALAAVGLALGAGTLLAQGSTGKIEGRVRDQAGAPIANAQVFVVGTAFNALTNPQGYYFINNVPAGTISVRSAFIGYKSTQVDGVKVLAGQTGTVDIQLEQTAVEIQEITVVSQTQPLVPRDEVTTKQRIDGSVADDLPVDRINDVLALQPGVTVDNTGNLSIRGGRNNEAATYVDGVPIQAGYRGDAFVGSLGTSLNIGTGAFEEASVTTGSSSAEFGNAKSGIVSIVTKTGGSRVPGLAGLRDRRAVRRERRHRVQPDRRRIQRPAGQPAHLRAQRHARGPSGDRGRHEQPGRADLPAGRRRHGDQPAQRPRRRPRDTRFDERTTADTTAVNVYNYAISRGECSEFEDAGSAGIEGPDAGADPGHPQQLRARLQRRPQPGDRADHLLAEREAELHLRHRLAGVAQPGAEPLPRALGPVPDVVPEHPGHRRPARLPAIGTAWPR